MQTTYTLPAKFIVFEGIDGAGKSTMIEWAARFLDGQNIPVKLTREPGGTKIGEQIRNLALHHPMCLETETLLMFAARQEHLQSLIFPTLKQGIHVLSDRFTPASYAYQGGARGLAVDKIRILEQWVQHDFQPDAVIVFDLPVSVSLSRMEKRHQTKDRFEQENIDFLTRVRQTYLTLAAQQPQRYMVIDADRDLIDVQEQLKNILTGLFNLQEQPL